MDPVSRLVFGWHITRQHRRAVCATIAVLVAVAPAFAQAPPPPASAPAADVSVTQHAITVDGDTLSYTATAGLQPVVDDAGKVLADMFFVAYTKPSVADETTRPVTFVFNGGPGAASVILHLDAVGPKRVQLGADDAPAASAAWIDNAYTWLRFTDLVVVDAIGTGYSRAAPDVPAAQFYQPEGDALSFARFVRAYLTENHRERSPKVLAGESYGGTRAVILARLLPRRFNIQLSAIILISPVLDFNTLNSQYGNPNRSSDLAFAADIPTYAAVAAYHKKLAPDVPADLSALTRQAAQWATAKYLPALAEGDALSQDAQDGVAWTLARYTGLTPSYVLAHHLRVLPRDFRRDLLVDDHLELGVMDGRFAVDPQDDRAAGTDAAVAPLGPIFRDYAQHELDYTDAETYVTLSGDVERHWDWQPSGTSAPLDVTNDLRDAMEQAPAMKVMVARGYYDLDVPYYGTEYALNRLRLPSAVASNLTRTYYESGHMVYGSEPMLAKLSADAAAVIAAAAGVH